MAYPEQNEDFVQCQARDVFLRGCTDRDTAEKVLDADPQTLYNAVKLHQKLAMNRRMLFGATETKKGNGLGVICNEDTTDDDPEATINVNTCTAAEAERQKQIERDKIVQAFRETAN